MLSRYCLALSRRFWAINSIVDRHTRFVVYLKLLQLPTCQHTQPLLTTTVVHRHILRSTTAPHTQPGHTLLDSFPCCVITNPRNKLGAVTNIPTRPRNVLTPPIEFVTVPIFESPMVLGQRHRIECNRPTTKTDASLSKLYCKQIQQHLIFLYATN